MTVTAFYSGYSSDGPTTIAIGTFVVDSVNGSFFVEVPLTVGASDTAASVAAGVPSAVDAYWYTATGLHVDVGIWLFNPNGVSTPKSFSNPSRALGTAFQPSTAEDTFGSYSVTIAATLSLSGGQLGSVILEYADDSAFTTNVKTVAQATNGNTGTLTLGLNTVQTYGANVSGIIPMSKWVRLRVSNVTGTPTTSFVNAQEVQF